MKTWIVVSVNSVVIGAFEKEQASLAYDLCEKYHKALPESPRAFVDALDYHEDQPPKVGVWGKNILKLLEVDDKLSKNPPPMTVTIQEFKERYGKYGASSLIMKFVHGAPSFKGADQMAFDIGAMLADLTSVLENA